MTKTLDDLISGRSKHMDLFVHNGIEVRFHGKTPTSSAHYKLLPTNVGGTTSSKKEAIKYLKGE